MPIQPGATFVAGEPRVVVRGAQWLAPDNWRNYDVSPDGSRFLMIRTADTNTGQPQIIVIQHWVDELKRLVAQQK